jgi:hypothetical protein
MSIDCFMTSAISGRDIILILGGLFLLGKSTLEIHGNLEGGESHVSHRAIRKDVTFHALVIPQRIYLFCHGLFDLSRGFEFEDP